MGKDICVHLQARVQTPGLGSLAPRMMLDKSEPQFPYLKDGNNKILAQSTLQKCDNTIFKGRGREQGNRPSSINAKVFSRANPISLTFRANQPEMGKVISSNKNPRKLMRPWQMQEGQV